MHRYLGAIGFDRVRTIGAQDALVGDVLRNYDFRHIAEDENGQAFAQITKEYGPDMGVTVCGYYDEEDLFHLTDFYPYYAGAQLTACEQLGIERMKADEAYMGACDDMRVGTTLIFYLLNTVEYLRVLQARQWNETPRAIALSSLAESGTILLPLEKDKQQRAAEEKHDRKRSQLYSQAAKGDERAIESLTMQDIDAYTMIARRIQHEDVYTIVDSYFMPYGLECDLYNIMGDITACREVQNERTGAKVWQLGIEANGIPIDLCINANDLTGEPQVGRRFKGIIWLQGIVHF